MLPLNDQRWGELSHAYGPAFDVPALLERLKSFPPDTPSSEPWHRLWSALCHQGDVYSASYAAVPHVVETLAANPERATESFFALPASIEVARVAHHAEVPEFLLADYSAAWRRMPGLVAAATSSQWDTSKTQAALAALAASKAQWSVATLLLEVESDDIEETLKWYLSR